MITVKDGWILAEDDSRMPDFEKQGGLVPAIVQEYTPDRRGRILMLAYANMEAFLLTLQTGLAHFWSRSRNELWKKGSTSGNLLVVKEVWLDCDRDTLIYMVENPPSVLCHLGRGCCFTRRAYIRLEEKHPKEFRHDVGGQEQISSGIIQTTGRES